MSATITTTTTTITTTFDNDTPGYLRPSFNGGSPLGAESSDILFAPSQRNQGSSDPLADVLDELGLPPWLKNAARNMLLAGDGGNQLPSESSAAKTINSFQRDNGIRYLSPDQVKQMAETGYFTDKNGKTRLVDDDVRLAAQKMMANGGELYRKLESAKNGEHDGKLSQEDYRYAVKDGTISANGGSGYEPTMRGISLLDFMNAIMNGNISSNRPSEYGAAKTINDFQKEHGISHLSIDQLQQMAETGYCKDKNGKFIQVPEEVQDAARAMAANNFELFKKLESATNGKHDGSLSIGDFSEAVQDGSISKGRGSMRDVSFELEPEDSVEGLPSRADAARTIRDFQKNNDIHLLDVNQVQQMAETGYYTDKFGRTRPVPDDVRLAAQRMAANNFELFKQLESATNGEHDGKLSQGDYTEAVKDGTIQGRSGHQPDYRYIRNPDETWPGGGDRTSATAATRTMQEFQAQHGIRFLNVDQVRQMATTGYCTDKDGNTIQVPEEVRQAAQRMAADNYALFKELESATNGEHDGRLSMKDYRNADRDRYFAT
ncbi:hypothetical protein SAMN05518865_106256 [Duganella sp. CF458]|uniref:hypothetical protein n=1 Tax=Duganella sp. CF458 TaxID=1884368 RepID=UPI0008E2BD9E|nr:hypothetical protein [Duganella sp. CF458]SFF95280.1 hypothetical protein SAMN05518865_106256 [Duganella sp. CF458]